MVRPRGSRRRAVLRAHPRGRRRHAGAHQGLADRGGADPAHRGRPARARDLAGHLPLRAPRSRRPALAARHALRPARGRLLSVYDELVAAHGPAASHRAVIEAVPAGSRVLDVGCAGGHLAAALAQVKGCTVVGLDRDVTMARARGIEAREADLDRDGLDASGFDVVVFADVLEHLRDPVATLRDARVAPLAVVSLPNIAHWTARRTLLG